MDISLCMIVRDEEENFPDTIKPLYELFNEVIIVDTGSQDQTKKLASEFTDNLYDFEWIDDFSAARNFADSKANSQMIMRWDADYRITEQGLNALKKELMKIREWDEPQYDILQAKWNVSFEKTNKPIKSLLVELIYNIEAVKWYSPIHNYIDAISDDYVPKYQKSLEIEFEHVKDLEKSEKRLSQSTQIMENYLNENPKDYRIKTHLLDTYKVTSRSKYLEYLSKLTEEFLKFSDPNNSLRFNVLQHHHTEFMNERQNRLVDVIAHIKGSNTIYKTEELLIIEYLLRANPEKGLYRLKKYVEEIDPESDLIILNPERYFTHPIKMLINIYEAIGESVEVEKIKKLHIKLLKDINE